jgi:hypothetical protein
MPRTTSPSSIELLLDALDCAFDKRSWHGPNLTGAIRGVDAKTAARRLPGRKCIWEQVLHAAYWKQAIINKLTGVSERLPRRGSNWPAMPERTDDAAWRADVQLLHDVHRRLRATIVGLDANALDAKARWLIYGAAAHDLYHAGQIKLLRRLVA